MHTYKGLWDIESVEISALETIHTGDYERTREQIRVEVELYCGSL